MLLKLAASCYPPGSLEGSLKLARRSDFGNFSPLRDQVVRFKLPRRRSPTDWLNWRTSVRPLIILGANAVFIANMDYLTAERRLTYCE